MGSGVLARVCNEKPEMRAFNTAIQVKYFFYFFWKILAH